LFADIIIIFVFSILYIDVVPCLYQVTISSYCVYSYTYDCKHSLVTMFCFWWLFAYAFTC